jgi:1-acyl-sn-glycerol-3-phosphate acyltransferase
MYAPKKESLLDERDPKTIAASMPYWEWLYRYYFRVKTDGWHHLQTNEQVLLIGSHNGGMATPDTYMVMYDWFRRFGTDRPVYGLMHPCVWKINPTLALLAGQIGAIPAYPQYAIAALHRGASLLVYPGGARDVFRPHTQRHKIHFAGSKAFIKLALREKIPIVPLISKGAHDTLIVLGDFYQWVKQLHQWGMPWLLDIDPEIFPVYLGLPWGVGIGPIPNLPLPVPIQTRVCAPIKFERYGREAARDRAYVDECFDLVANKMQRELDYLVECG